MKSKWLVHNTERLFAGFIFATIFIFFAFFYKYHLQFEEQQQFFLLTIDYFLSKISLPGGLAGYAGEFLIQFYYLTLAGPLIITLLILGIQQSTRHILSSVNTNGTFFPLSFIPSIAAVMLLCNEFYPLSAIVGFLIALLLSGLYIKIEDNRIRFISGVLIIPLAYWLTGGSFLTSLSVILVFEIFIIINCRKKPGEPEILKINPGGNLKIWHLAAYLALAAGVPLLVQTFVHYQPLMPTYISSFYYDIYNYVPRMIFVFFSIPALLMIILVFLPEKGKIHQTAIFFQMGVIIVLVFLVFRFLPDYRTERIMAYDYLVRNEQWMDAITFAEKKPPADDLSLAMLNLSLARADKMGDRLFNYEQNGINGLFLPDSKEFISFMIASEIYFHLGLVNASQEYAFESMSITPNMNETVRSVRRLAETNLINGQYEVSQKYLKLLKKTIFYRKWARDAEKYLYNEDLINNHPVWGEKRKLMIKKDFFFNAQNMESVLKMLLIENPRNKLAFEYLMAFYLIKKDLRNFIDNLYLMSNLSYLATPVSYQEAIMYVIVLTRKDPVSSLNFNISEDTKSRMKAYADIYTTIKNPQESLKKKFSATYWYYVHFKSMQILDTN